MCHTGNLTQSGVRLLGRHRLDDQTNTTALGASLQRRRFRMRGKGMTPLADQLINCRHECFFPYFSKTERIIYQKLDAYASRYLKIAQFVHNGVIRELMEEVPAEVQMPPFHAETAARGVVETAPHPPHLDEHEIGE